MLSCCQNEAKQPARTVRVLTDRTASHLRALLETYQAKTGVEVVTNFVGDGLLPRLSNRPKEADLIITKSAFLLELAKRQGLLAPFASVVVDQNVPAVFRDPDRYFTAISYRARLLFYAKDRVKPEQLSTYLMLAEPEWRGRVCIRPGAHDYNVSLFAQMAHTYGLERVRSFLEGLRQNLAHRPKGNDRDQVRAIAEGECDLAVVNSYYQGMMLANEEQRPWALAAAVFFPDQDEGGAFILRSGAGLTTATDNQTEATKLLEFLTDDDAQRYFAEALFAYPVKADVSLSRVNVGLGQPQGIMDGRFEWRPVPLAAIADNRDAILESLAQLGFDE